MASISAPRTAPFRSPTRIGSRSCRSGRRAPAARCRRSCTCIAPVSGSPGLRASRHSSPAAMRRPTAGAARAHLKESEAEAFNRLREAANAAGFEEVEFMAEPVAAVIGEERHAGVEIAVDFGGGTFDVAVMDSRRETPRISGTAGVAVGGELLDGVLFETVVGPALGLDRLPYWLFNDLRTASSVRLVMADPRIPSILARIGGDVGALVHALLYKGHAYDFHRAIEAAKIELSDSESAAITHAPPRVDRPV